MFKNGKIVGLSLALSCVSGVGAQFAVADGETEIVPDGPSTFANLKCEQLKKILDDVHWKAFDADLARRCGDIEKSERLKKEVEYLVKKYDLDVFLMYEDDLDSYAALFDLGFCEDLDRDANWVFGEKDDEIKKLVNLDAWYTKTIIASKKALRSYERDGFSNIEGTMSAKKNLASFFTLRSAVRKLLALRVSQYGIDLEKHFIDVGQEENINSDSTEKNASSVSKEEKEQNTQSDTSKKKSNKEQQSLVRNDAVSNESWSFSDIVFGIKNQVESLLGLKEEEKEFVSKEEDLKREAKRQETEFSLSLLVNRFLSWVRGSDRIGALDKNENIKKNSGNSANLLVSGQNNLLTDGTESNQQ